MDTNQNSQNRSRDWKKGQKVILASLCFLYGTNSLAKCLDWVDARFPPFLEPGLALLGYTIAMYLLLKKEYSGHILCAALFLAEIVYTIQCWASGDFFGESRFLALRLQHSVGVLVGLYFSAKEVRVWAKQGSWKE